MKLNKRIGVIMGRVYKNLNQQLLSGILEQAHSEGFTAYIFTLNEECNNSKITFGEENLFSLINFSLLDGIVFAPYTFSSAEYSSYAEAFLLQHCTIPVIRIGIEKEHFIPVWYDDRAEFSETVRHLIDEHHCRKIVCLTGPEELQVAQNRAEGYMDAMRQAGLAVETDDVIFGDFWVYSAQRLAAEIADGSRQMPDAVVCANDAMAIALCDALSEKGFSVPEDVRITGYDGYTETRMHIPAITTYQTSQKLLGRKVMCRLYQEITGEFMPTLGTDVGQLLCRESCGCNSQDEHFDNHEFDYQKFEESFMDCTLSAALHDVSSLNGFVENMYSMLFKFMDNSRFHTEHFYLCLCDDWDSITMKGSDRIYRTEGYSEMMMLISAAQERISYPSSAMLPDMLYRESPRAVFFTAAHFQERCFGYLCLDTDGTLDDFNINYIRFCREINNGLEFLCTQNELKRLVYRKYLASSRDDLTGLYLLENCPQMWEELSGLAELYGENVYLIVISPCGLKHIENAAGAAEREKYFVLLADMLAKSCINKEKIFRSGDSNFVIIGSERAPVSRPEQFLKTAAERFQQQNIISDDRYLVYLKRNIKVFPTAPNISFDAMIALVKDMLTNLSGTPFKKFSEQIYYQKLIDLRREIYLHPERDWNGAICSQQLNISQSYYHRLYRQIFEVNFLRDVQQSRLSCAKRLLLTTTETLSEIAEKCGYDYSNFMRFFKKETGMTPTQFRKEQ